MKRILAAVTVAIGAMGFAASANAALFDFASMADNAGDPNYKGESAHQPLVATVDGITLIVDGYNFTGTTGGDFHSIRQQKVYAYLDAGDAGLGVCQTSNCAGSSDDNVTAGEALYIRTGGLEEITLEMAWFDDQNHNEINGDQLIDIFVGNIDGSVTAWYLDIPMDSPSILNITGTHFMLFHNGDPEDFYVNALAVSRPDQEVPEPAALGLVGLGLIGAGFAARRRRAA